MAGRVSSYFYKRVAPHSFLNVTKTNKSRVATRKKLLKILKKALTSLVKSAIISM